MTDPEYAVISEWFNFLITCPQLNFKIDQIIYLRTDPEVAYERIKKRKRPEEHLIPYGYLKGKIIYDCNKGTIYMKFHLFSIIS